MKTSFSFLSYLTARSGRGGRGGGRGQYYKSLYGGGRGRGRGAQSSSQDSTQSSTALSNGGVTKDWTQLQNDLLQIDGSQYGAYNRLLGKYAHAQPNFTLSVDHIQGDPYAAPSRVRAIMPWNETGFPN